MGRLHFTTVNLLLLLRMSHLGRVRSLASRLHSPALVRRVLGSRNWHLKKQKLLFGKVSKNGHRRYNLILYTVGCFFYPHWGLPKSEWILSGFFPFGVYGIVNGSYQGVEENPIACRDPIRLIEGSFTCCGVMGSPGSNIYGYKIILETQ